MGAWGGGGGYCVAGKTGRLVATVGIGSDIISEINEEKAWEHKIYSRLSIFSDDRKTAMFIRYSEDNLMYAFRDLKYLISVMQEEKERIRVTFYPETQTILKKFFPMTGDEERPYVAIKLHLQEKQG